MDTTPLAAPGVALNADALQGLVVTGASWLAPPPGEAVDVLPWLQSRKSRKFMAKQDELAVAAAGAALRDAGLLDDPARADLGLYLAVGHLAFERADIEAIADRSLDAQGQFSMRQFAGEGIDQVNPLLTFRCLPNMPAYHVSVNFGLQGPYLLLYPGVAQAYEVLMQACDDLAQGRIAQALVGGVADQLNFLVDFHFQRDAQRRQLPRADGAGFLVLEHQRSAQARGARIQARPLHVETRYPSGPQAPVQSSAAELACGVARWLQRGHGDEAFFEHRAASLDGCSVHSRWEIAP